MKLRILPVPSGDVARPMLHYDLAAQFVLWVPERGEGGLFTAADPEPFVYRWVDDALRQNTAIQLNPLSVPEAALRVVCNQRCTRACLRIPCSVVTPMIYCKQGIESRQYADIVRIARKIQDD